MTDIAITFRSFQIECSHNNMFTETKYPPTSITSEQRNPVTGPISYITMNILPLAL